MKRLRRMLCMAGIGLFFLSGCGIQNSAGDHDVKKTVEPMEEDAADTAKRPQETANDRFQYGNDVSFYASDGNQIVQYKRTGQYTRDEDLVRTYTVVDEKEIELTGVNNKEVFFCIEKGDTEQLWRIPIERKGKGETLLTDQAEMILTDDEVGFDCVYADENVIAYSGFSDYDRYVEYDRETKQYISIDANSDEHYGLAGDIELSSWVFRNLKTAGILLTRYNEKEDDVCGIYYHRLGSGRVKKICDAYYDSEGLQYVASTDKFFYTGFEKEDFGTCTYDVYVYDGRTGENRVFIKEEQWRQLAAQKGFTLDESDLIFDMHLDDEKLYLAISVRDLDDYLIASMAVDDASSLTIEKEMSDYVKSIGFPSYLDIIDGKAVMTSGDLYDLETGKSKEIEEEEYIVYS